MLKEKSLKKSEKGYHTIDFIIIQLYYIVGNDNHQNLCVLCLRTTKSLLKNMFVGISKKNMQKKVKKILFAKHIFVQVSTLHPGFCNQQILLMVKQSTQISQAFLHKE